VRRRDLRLGPVFVSAAVLLCGCESLDHTRRPHEYDVKSDAEDTPETKGFFKSSRLSGAMSSEGRDIERSLGVR
jgi:hypothetical protein